MAADMKTQIAEAVNILLLNKRVKRLTVKDIVEMCHITRQTFYYHFEDIPSLLYWMLDCNTETMLKECVEQKNPEQGLKYLFLISINIRPFMEAGMHTNYKEELEKIVTQLLYSFCECIVERKGFYMDCSRRELDIILRYHSQAVLGMLKNWTPKDTENLDQIVHTIYQIHIGKNGPYEIE